MRVHGRLHLVLVAMTTLSLGIAALGSGASATSPPSTSVRWDARDVRVSDAETLFEGDQKNLYEPSIAIDPTDPRRVIAFAIDLSTQNKHDMYSTNRAFRSTDGGRSWRDLGPMRYGRDRNEVWSGGDPVAVFSRDGTAYFASLAEPPGRAGGGIYVHRSSNAGRSWARPTLAVDERCDPELAERVNTDKEWLSVDGQGNLYLTYTAIVTSCDPTRIPESTIDALARMSDMGIFLTKSTDRGRTWTEPEMIWDGYALGSIPKVGPDGTLYVSLWSTVPSPGLTCPGAIGLVLAKVGGTPFYSIVTGSSKDGGTSWSWHEEPVCGFEAGELTKPGRFVGGRFLPSLSVDGSTNTAFVAFPSFVASEARFTIQLISSSDGGASWSAPREVTPGPGDSQIPVVFASDGIVRMTYVETTGTKDQNETTADGTSQTLYVESGDDGSSWSQPVSLGTKVGQPKEYTELGDYNALDVVGDRIAAIWTDARHERYGQIWARVGSLITTRARSRSTATSPPLPISRGPLRSSVPLASPPVVAAPFAALGHRALATAMPAPSEVPRRCRLVAITPLSRANRGANTFSSLTLPCSVQEAMSLSRRSARNQGYELAFADFEGFEAEMFFTRSTNHLLVKIISASGGDASRVLLKKFR